MLVLLELILKGKLHAETLPVNSQLPWLVLPQPFSMQLT